MPGHNAGQSLYASIGIVRRMRAAGCAVQENEGKQWRHEPVAKSSAAYLIVRNFSGAIQHSGPRPDAHSARADCFGARVSYWTGVLRGSGLGILERWVGEV